jgi:hypothetical protein
MNRVPAARNREAETLFLCFLPVKVKLHGAVRGAAGGCTLVLTPLEGGALSGNVIPSAD